MAWSNAINIWIVGPGLGRDPNIAQFFPTLVKNLPSQDVIVFNADGIYHLCQHP
jgi:NAD(P)H-hydrate repair Nnr-like enzyme with NAD(P)H-hydrate dehydratase domain